LKDRLISTMWAELIRPAMHRKRIYSQGALARATGLSEGTVTNIKYGSFNRIHLKTLEKLASTLTINIAKLMAVVDKGAK